MDSELVNGKWGGGKKQGGGFTEARKLTQLWKKYSGTFDETKAAPGTWFFLKFSRVWLDIRDKSRWAKAESTSISVGSRLPMPLPCETTPFRASALPDKSHAGSFTWRMGSSRVRRASLAPPPPVSVPMALTRRFSLYFLMWALCQEGPALSFTQLTYSWSTSRLEVFPELLSIWPGIYLFFIELTTSPWPVYVMGSFMTLWVTGGGGYVSFILRNLRT